MPDIVGVPQSEKSEFTRSERILTDIILLDVEAVLKMSIVDLAAQAEVSPPTGRYALLSMVACSKPSPPASVPPPSPACAASSTSSSSTATACAGMTPGRKFNLVSQSVHQS